MEPDNLLNGKKEKWFPLFWDWEQRWIAAVVPKLPSYLNGYSLTLMSIPEIFLILLFSWLAQNSLFWLIGVSLVILFQYLTDSLDGAVGRYRKSGLEKWGYYMDHLLDFLFMSSIIIGYAFFMPENLLSLISLLAIVGSFYVSSFLASNVTRKFRMSYYKIGPTEMRFFIIGLNILMIIFKPTFMTTLLPILTAVFLAILVFTIYSTQKQIIDIDKDKINLTSKNNGN
ncbi:MAG: CDP-alcohol phosphatidyltransferase family protein [Patescibacteria group bacterium]|jgi:phosphatidylglycerophosphate synthase